ncbi:hypothetical protein FDP41_003710 [Naegleria fowleri]|uniref:COP9 signalosome complex subunit 6 n=1 Tax=Naegleria fowleri TaxID=5763 RepID=A0A6A5BJA6_NAEFO|nr:uncharacterized protein FDP41_003710 [Naegleria fowleri]KAF0977057.1 hypothetical protein FDP41_003710 [Naegleria fowleri]CAG4715373.1 unnamed protein product [Naegleria fowleri]
MSTSQDSKKVEESTSAIDLYIHPLIIINISDHYTRKKYQLKQGSTPVDTSLDSKVLGILFGTQDGRRVEVRTSFELIFTVDKSGVVNIDHTYLQEKIEQYKQVFKNYDVLGWYSTGTEIRPEYKQIHEEIARYNESPLMILVGVAFGSVQKELPLYVYESNINASSGTVSWATLNYKIETEESERIVVDQVNRMDKRDGSSSSLVPQYITLSNAVNMLIERVEVLINYLEQVKQGKIEPDHKKLREISSLSHRLPAVVSDKFNSDYVNDVNESLIITYLATMTKGVNQFNNVVDKYMSLSAGKKRMY